MDEVPGRAAVGPRGLHRIKANSRGPAEFSKEFSPGSCVDQMTMLDT